MKRHAADDARYALVGRIVVLADTDAVADGGRP
jgi:hypothetical protein